MCRVDIHIPFRQGSEIVQWPSIWFWTTTTIFSHHCPCRLRLKGVGFHIKSEGPQIPPIMPLASWDLSQSDKEARVRIMQVCSLPYCQLLTLGSHKQSAAVHLEVADSIYSLPSWLWVLEELLPALQAFPHLAWEGGAWTDPSYESWGYWTDAWAGKKGDGWTGRAACDS